MCPPLICHYLSVSLMFLLTSGRCRVSNQLEQIVNFPFPFEWNQRKRQMIHIINLLSPLSLCLKNYYHQDQMRLVRTGPTKKERVLRAFSVILIVLTNFRALYLNWPHNIVVRERETRNDRVRHFLTSYFDWKVWSCDKMLTQSSYWSLALPCPTVMSILSSKICIKYQPPIITQSLQDTEPQHAHSKHCLCHS